MTQTETVQSQKFYEIDDDGTWVPIEDPNKNHGVAETAFGASIWNEMWVRRTDIRKTSWMECSRCDSARAFS